MSSTPNKYIIIKGKKGFPIYAYHLDKNWWYGEFIKTPYCFDYPLDTENKILAETNNLYKAKYLQIKLILTTEIGSNERKSWEKSMKRIEKLYPEQII